MRWDRKIVRSYDLDRDFDNQSCMICRVIMNHRFKLSWINIFLLIYFLLLSIWFLILVLAFSFYLLKVHAHLSNNWVLSAWHALVIRTGNHQVQHIVHLIIRAGYNQVQQRVHLSIEDSYNLVQHSLCSIIKKRLKGKLQQDGVMTL